MHEQLPSAVPVLRRFPWLTAAVCALAFCVAHVPAVSDAAAYDRTAVAAGEVWRLVTGHLTHWNFEHLAWDVFLFGLLGSMVEWRSRRCWLLAVGLSVAAISGWTWWYAPELHVYRGLSGVDSALFTTVAAFALGDASREKRWVPAVATLLLLVGFAGKIGFEIASGQTLFVDSSAAGFLPVPAAHAIGAAVGAVVACGCTARWTSHARRGAPGVAAG